MRAFTKEWLKASRDDLLTIEEIINNPHLTHIVAFHSQQCVEKSMKAIIEDNEIDIPNGKPTINDAKEFYIFAHSVFDEVCRVLGTNPDEIAEE